MVLQIPGYYYDEEKNKYYKVDRNGAKNHEYSGCAIKRKLERDEVNIKISKLKLSTPYSGPPSFIRSSLGVSRKFKLESPHGFTKSIKTYRLSNLELQRGSPMSLPHLDETQSQLRSCYLSNGNIRLICLTRGDHFSAYQISNSLSSSSSRTHDYAEKLILKTEDYFGSLQNYTLKSSQGTLDGSGTINLVHTYNNSANGTSKIIGSCFSFYNSEVLSNNFKITNEWVNDSAVLPQSSKIITCGDKSIISRSLLTMDVESSIGSKGDALTLDFCREQENICYLGFRNGHIKLWDMRVSSRSFSMQENLRNFKSLTKLKVLTENHIICSSLGSRIDLFDRRIGFTKPKLSYMSIKNVQDVHGEQLQVIDEENFMISNKATTEIFNIYQERPLKVISTFDTPIETSVISHDGSYDLFTFGHGKYSLFSG